MERSDFAARFGKFALVTGASLALIVVAGLLVSMKRDEDRLRRLEARLASQSAATPEHELVTATPTADALAVADEAKPQAVASEDHQAPREAETVRPPQTAKPLTETPRNVDVEAPNIAETSSRLPAAGDDHSTGDAYSLPSAATELEAPGAAFASWFSSTELGGLPQELQPKVCAADRSLGTVLTWSKSPEEAEATARRERKLVFLIHVSGNFEDAGFT